MSEIVEMFKNSKHHRFEQTTWTNQPYYIREDNTIYKLHHFYNARNYLRDQSDLFTANEYKVYVPVATKETDGDKEILTGYIWERANMSNFLLAMAVSERSVYYPNLVWCEIGNHPYPSQVRFHDSWLERKFNQTAQKLIHPDYEIAKAVRFPSLLGLSPTPP